MLVVQCERYDDLTMKLGGKLWSVDDAEFLQEPNATRFDLKVHDGETDGTRSVSYTHLTLPTILRV